MKEGKRKSGGVEKESKFLRREGGWIGEKQKEMRRIDFERNSGKKYDRSD